MNDKPFIAEITPKNFEYIELMKETHGLSHADLMCMIVFLAYPDYIISKN